MVVGEGVWVCKCDLFSAFFHVVLHCVTFCKLWVVDLSRDVAKSFVKYRIDVCETRNLENKIYDTFKL